MLSNNGFEIQKQIRENSNEFRDTILDLQNWEQEIKMKEKQFKSEQNGKNEELTEIRTKRNKSPPKSKPETKVEFQSYTTEDRRNEENDEANKKLADEEKEKGNCFVKEKQYDKALEHYNSAIKLYSKDPVYYSNRAFCYLKLENFTASVADCTKSISLDTDPASPILIKSLYRRMLAYESLQKYDKALQDCTKLKKLEPNKNFYQTYCNKLVALVDENRFNLNKLETTDFIMKPPNQRSKKPLRRISITEIDADSCNGACGNSVVITSDHMPDNLKIPDDVLDSLFNNATGASSAGHHTNYGRNYKKRPNDETKKPGPSPKVKEKSATTKANSVVEPSITAASVSDIDPKNIDSAKIKIPPAPKSGSQFEIAWRELSIQQKYLYLIELRTVKNLRKIFDSSLTSEILSELLLIMKEYFTKSGLEVYYYLKEISCCSEISILAMMMSPEDKSNLNELFSYLKQQNNAAYDLSAVKKNFIG